MEVLRAEYQALCEEETAILSQLERTKFDAQQLSLRLRTLGAKTASLIPSNLRCGNSSAGGQRNADMATAEHRSLLKWLAEGVDMTQQIEFNAPGEVHIGDYEVTLGRMVQWPLSGLPGDLKLSVPKEREQEIAALLSRVRKGILGSNELWDLSESWELIGADVMSEEGAQPAIFLVRPESLQALVVAPWPSLPTPTPTPVIPSAPSAAVPTFDPFAHFAGRHTMTEDVALPMVSFEFVDTYGVTHSLSSLENANRSLCWQVDGHEARRIDDLGVYFSSEHQCTLTGPFGPTVVVDPAPGHAQRELVERLIAVASERGMRVRCERSGGVGVALIASEALATQSMPPLSLSTPIAAPPLLEVASGDDVEVKYDGEWYSGVLHCVMGEVAHINCYVDDPNVITMVHVSSVRRAPRLHRNLRRSSSEPSL